MVYGVILLFSAEWLWAYKTIHCLTFYTCDQRSFDVNHCSDWKMFEQVIKQCFYIDRNELLSCVEILKTQTKL